MRREIGEQEDKRHAALLWPWPVVNCKSAERAYYLDPDFSVPLSPNLVKCTCGGRSFAHMGLDLELEQSK